MTYQELINRVREKLDDTRKPFLWEDSELADGILESLQYFLSETEALKKTFETKIRKGTRYTEVDQTVLSVDEVYFENVFISLWPKDDLPIDQATGTPIWYYFKDSAIWLYPLPDEDGMLEYRGPYTITSIKDKAKSLPIKDRDQLILIDGAMERAYLKQDSETFNPQQSKIFGSRFIFNVEKVKQKITKAEYNPRVNPIAGGLL